MVFKFAEVLSTKNENQAPEIDKKKSQPPSNQTLTAAISNCWMVPNNPTSRMVFKYAHQGVEQRE